ncbi:MAG: class I tRNA ligase family protein, partial [Acidimicrobiia bacterium]|nr:class I tRNA ligase family protein [Acidimicrobiia bacterium]
LVKGRAYRDDDSAASAHLALRTALSTLLRLFAPFLPYATEEVWSWCGDETDRLDGFETQSVHRAPWPTAEEIRAVGGGSGGADASVLTVTAEVLGRIRKAKSDAKASMRADVETVTVTDTAARIAALRLAEADLLDAGKATELLTVEGPDDGEPTVEVVLSPTTAEG